VREGMCMHMCMLVVVFVCACFACECACVLCVCVDHTRAHVCVCGGCVSACMCASAPREGGSGMAIARLHVAYPGGETSLRGPEDRLWPDDS